MSKEEILKKIDDLADDIESLREAWDFGYMDEETAMNSISETYDELSELGDMLNKLEE